MQAVAQQSDPVVEAGWAEVWLATEPTARLVVDWALTVLWRNPSANSLLGTGALLQIRDGVLASADRRMTAQLQSIVWNVKPGRPTSAVIGAPDEGALLITGVALNNGGRACVGMLIREIDLDPRYELPDLEPVFGLTPAEQQIVALLLAGMSSAEIARKLDKSILTVRTHVKHAYGKLGIPSKEQLFAKLLRYGVVW